MIAILISEHRLLYWQILHWSQNIPRKKVKEYMFMAGPIKKLAWSKWELAISRNFSPNDNLNHLRIFEVGVTLSGTKKRRVYPMYFRSSLGFHINKGVEPIGLVHNPGDRIE